MFDEDFVLNSLSEINRLIEGFHDIHICGACRAEFSNLGEFLQHKTQCKLLLRIRNSRYKAQKEKEERALDAIEGSDDFLSDKLITDGLSVDEGVQVAIPSYRRNLSQEPDGIDIVVYKEPLTPTISPEKRRSPGSSRSPGRRTPIGGRRTPTIAKLLEQRDSPQTSQFSSVPSSTQSCTDTTTATTISEIPIIPVGTHVRIQHTDNESEVVPHIVAEDSLLDINIESFINETSGMDEDLPIGVHAVVVEDAFEEKNLLVENIGRKKSEKIPKRTRTIRLIPPLHRKRNNKMTEQIQNDSIRTDKGESNKFSTVSSASSLRIPAPSKETESDTLVKPAPHNESKRQNSNNDSNQECSKKIKIYIRDSSGKEITQFYQLPKIVPVREPVQDRVSMGEFSCNHCSFSTNDKCRYDFHILLHKVSDDNATENNIRETEGPEHHNVTITAGRADIETDATDELAEVDRKPIQLQKGPNNQYSCSKCSYVSKRREHFLAHLKCHVGSCPFVCSLCTARFSTRRSRTEHGKRAHAVDIYF